MTSAATITVDDPGDSLVGSPFCQLRAAIEAAETDAEVDGCDAGSGPDRIVFSGVSAILLSDSLPTILEDLEIEGPGADELTIDGDDQFALLRPRAITFAVRGLTLLQGETTDGEGACLDASGTDLTVEHVKFVGCTGSGISSSGIRLASATSTFRHVELTASRGSVGVLFIFNGSATLEDSLLHANLDGVTLNALFAPIEVLRSTIHNNEHTTASAIFSSADLTLRHSTVNGNRRTTNSLGGAVQVGGLLTIENSIIAGNTYSVPSTNNPDLNIAATGSLVRIGFNMIGVNKSLEADFPAGQPNTNGDWVGTQTTPLEPLLESLAANGGFTRTLMPQAASPAVDNGSCPGQLADQRGYGNAATGLRAVDIPGTPNVDDGCDIGAVERGATEFPLFADGFESGNTNSWS